jgi:hypothetical protein
MRVPCSKGECGSAGVAPVGGSSSRTMHPFPTPFSWRVFQPPRAYGYTSRRGMARLRGVPQIESGGALSTSDAPSKAATARRHKQRLTSPRVHYALFCVYGPRYHLCLPHGAHTRSLQCVALLPPSTVSPTNVSIMGPAGHHEWLQTLHFLHPLAGVEKTQTLILHPWPGEERKWTKTQDPHGGDPTQ